MTNHKIQVSRKVLKKLSAVRAVLSKPEREILDAIVLGEAKAHMMAAKKSGKATRKSSRNIISTKKARAKMSKADSKSEVKAHVMPKVMPKAHAKAISKKQAQAH